MEYREHCFCDQRNGLTLKPRENKNNSTPLEIYKLHSELADKVSQRREGANRLYASLITFVILAISAGLRLADISRTTFILVAILGAWLSLSWYLVIRSYEKLNAGKFQVLRKLEDELPYQFFQHEWKALTENKTKKVFWKKNRYWRLTVVESLSPLGFCLAFLCLLVATLKGCFP